MASSSSRHYTYFGFYTSLSDDGHTEHCSRQQIEICNAVLVFFFDEVPQFIVYQDEVSSTNLVPHDVVRRRGVVLMDGMRWSPRHSSRARGVSQSRL